MEEGKTSSQRTEKVQDIVLDYADRVVTKMTSLARNETENRTKSFKKEELKYVTDKMLFNFRNIGK